MRTKGILTWNDGTKPKGCSHAIRWDHYSTAKGDDWNGWLMYHGEDASPMKVLSDELWDEWRHALAAWVRMLHRKGVK